MSNVISLRLQALGFVSDPFQPLIAEMMQNEILEATFVAHHGFDESIMDLDKSAVMLAQSGGGKTAGRLQLATALQRRQAGYFEHDLKANVPPYTPLVASYTDFQQLTDNFPTESERYAGKLPDIRLKDHTRPLMSAIAEALATFIISYPAHFRSSSEYIRTWNRSFILTYLRSWNLVKELSERLPEDNWQREDKLLIPYQFGDSIELLLENLEQALKGLGLDRLVILVDNVDGYPETKQAEYQAALILPLLNALALLSLEFVTWKFFLPKDIELSVHESSGRKNRRFDIVSIEWTEETLKALLEGRMKAASNPLSPLTITKLSTDELLQKVDIEAELVQMALNHPELGPPRALLELASLLFHSAKYEAGADPSLSLGDWESFLHEFQNTLLSGKEASDKEAERTPMSEIGAAR